MDLKQLKEAVDYIYDRLPNNENPENVRVLITLDDPSIGCKAYSEVYSASIGFDWEENQFRIQPLNNLIKKL